MALTRNDVSRIADLARLELNERERDELLTQIDILDTQVSALTRRVAELEREPLKP